MNSLAVLGLEGSSGTRKKSSFYTTSGREVRSTFGIEPEEMNYMTMNITYNGYALRPETHRVRLLPSPFHERSALARNGQDVLRQPEKILPH